MEEILERINTGINFLMNGLPFRVGDQYWGVDIENYFNVTGASHYLHLEQITRNFALKELQEIKDDFLKMVYLSSELKEFIKDKKLKFNLDFDYGMGDIRICSEKEGILKWELLRFNTSTNSD